jgi:NAD(P)-dependent dehydrogenase (short-subunit alcohol dehydrogenase family)
MQLADASAIVTGGAGGFGSATVRRLIAAGAKVVIADIADDKAQALVDELGKENAFYHPTNVTSEKDLRSAIAAAQELAPLRAAVTPHGGPVLGGRIVGKNGAALEQAGFEQTLQYYLVGTYNVMRLAAEQMAKNDPVGDSGRGVIVTTASIAGLEGQTGQVPYAAAKGGVIAMTIAAARDLSVLGIRVNCIAPGVFHTPAFIGMSEDTIMSFAGKGIQFPQRLGQPDEYAKLAMAIIDTDYLNGETIRIDAALRFPPK